MLKRAMPLAALAAAAIGETGCGPIAGGERPGQGEGQRARVIGAVDGDTLPIRSAGRERYVRLIGIDAPASVRPAAGPGCGSLEAPDSMKGLAAEGSEVELRTDPSQERADRHGRLLRDAGIGGRDVAEAQLRRGWAEPCFCGGNPFARLGGYGRAARRASGIGSGGWGGCGGELHSGG